MSAYEDQKRYRQKNPVKMRGYQRKWLNLNRAKVSNRKKQYCEENKEKIREYRQKYNQEHKLRAEELRLRRRFNLSLEQVDDLLIKQHHKCPICQIPLMETQRCIDHDHRNGKVRGILCRNCNFGIGYFKDNPNLLESAIQYLDGEK